MARDCWSIVDLHAGATSANFETSIVLLSSQPKIHRIDPVVWFQSTILTLTPSRLPKLLRASVRKALRKVWQLEDADKAKRLLRDLAHRLVARGARRCCQYPRGALRDADRQSP